MGNSDNNNKLRKELSQWVDEYESRLTKENPEKIGLAETIGVLASSSVSHVGVKISTSLHDPTPEMGDVCINGKKIDVVDTDKFAYCIQKASNFEVTPKLDNSVDIDFGIHGIMEIE